MRRRVDETRVFQEPSSDAQVARSDVLTPRAVKSTPLDIVDCFGEDQTIAPPEDLQGWACITSPEQRHGLWRIWFYPHEIAAMTIRRIVSVLSFMALPLIAWMGWHVYTHLAFWTLHGQTRDRIGSLRQERPTNISPERWEEASGRAGTAFCNLWPWDSDSHGDLEKFSAGLEEKMAAGNSLATLRWIWDELEHNTKAGPRYAAAYKPVRAMAPDPITDDKELQRLHKAIPKCWIYRGGVNYDPESKL